MSGRSTTTQLLLVYDELSRVLDNQGQVDVVYLDLTKTFDKVSHDLLTHKLKPQGSILGPLLFLMYIDDMTQAVDSGLCKLAFYADDAKLYKDIDSIKDWLELGLMRIKVWSRIWNCRSVKLGE